MKYFTRIFMGFLVATVMLAFTTKTVMAQEKAKAAPAEEKAKAEKSKGQSTTKVLFENEKYRVVET